MHSAPKYSSTTSRSTLFSYLCRMADSTPSPFPQALSVPAHRSLHQRLWTKKVGHCLATPAIGGQRQSVLVPSRTFYISRALSLCRVQVCCWLFIPSQSLVVQGALKLRSIFSSSYIDSYQHNIYKSARNLKSHFSDFLHDLLAIL